MRHHSLCLLAIVIGSTAAAQTARLTGTLVVTNKTPSTVTLLDVASGRVLATLPTGNGPHEVVITGDGSTAVVTDYGAQIAGSSLTVIDVPGKRVARTISLGEYRRPHGIALLPGDTLAVVTSETNRAVLIVDIRSGTIVRAIPTAQNGSHMVAVTGDGRRAWTGNIGSNTVSELDLTTGAALRTIAVPAQPEAINVTPDGRSVWVGSNATGVVSVVDAMTEAVTPVATGLSWPYRVLYSPDTSLVLVPDFRAEMLRLIDRRTHRELARLTLAGKGPQGITFAPNGRKAFLSFSATGKIAVIDIASRIVEREIDTGPTPDGVAYTRRTMAP